MDLLADVLAVSGVRGALAANIEAGASWGYAMKQSHGAVFHAVTAGTAWLELAGRPAVQLMPGDVVLLPKGAKHSLSSELGAVIIPSEEEAGAEAGLPVRIGTGPVTTHILCAHYWHDPAISTRVFAALPEVLHIHGENSGTGLDDTIRLLARELASPQPAAAVVLNNLVNILLIQLLRDWLARRPPELERSWLGVLNDPLMTDALTRLHEAPERPWTTAKLAAELAVSRATLARHFAAVAGETPGSYLTRWRMDLAAVRLRDTDETLEVIAHSVGYTSVYAFSRAFQRSRSEAPGRYRTSARAQQ
jgi:AraC-like DNA-binding protein